MAFGGRALPRALRSVSFISVLPLRLSPPLVALLTAKLDERSVDFTDQGLANVLWGMHRMQVGKGFCCLFLLVYLSFPYIKMFVVTCMNTTHINNNIS